MDPSDEEEPMDEYDVPPDYDAPTPPPPPPSAPPSAPPPAPPSHARAGTPRLLMAGLAVGVLAVAGGAGFALGRGGGTTGNRLAPGYGFGGQAPQSGQGGLGGTPFTGPSSPGAAPYDSSSNGDQASASQLTGLVRIASTLKYQGGLAAGTGMVLTSTGEVVTNHHVVQGATAIRVTVMSTGRQYSATVVGTDAKDDVAVLQLANATGLATVHTDTSPATIGEAVTAVGDAGGSTTAFTAATGSVSAINQHITTNSEDGRTSERLRGLIEISSDVISGDSGGATYDDQGEVVGMTTAASTGGSDIVGYAIPIARVLQVTGDLENGVQNARYDYGAPAFAGISLAGDGTTVDGVFPGTPAQQAGITAGDTITRVGTTRVHTSAALRSAITSYSPGDQVTLVWTDTSGTSHVAGVTLIAGPVA
jgi:S1-C subfamily serine protease